MEMDVEMDEEERALVAEAAAEGEKLPAGKTDREEQEEEAPSEVVQAVEDEDVPIRVVKNYKRMVSGGCQEVHSVHPVFCTAIYIWQLTAGSETWGEFLYQERCFSCTAVLAFLSICRKGWCSLLGNSACIEKVAVLMYYCTEREGRFLTLHRE